MLRGTFNDDGIEIFPSDERKVYSFSSITIDNKEKAIEHLRNIELEDDKLVNVVFCTVENEAFVSITVHHFLIDLVSWEVLIKDFNTVVKQLKKKEKIDLPAKTASFRLWSAKLNQYEETMPEENRAYWNNITEKLDNARSINADEKINEAEEYSFTYDREASQRASL